MTLRWLQPDLLQLSAGQFVTQHALAIDAAGRIAAVEPIEALPATITPRRLPDQILLPGFVNAHSHAFQRAMRGSTEHLQVGHESDDFWSWRERMYQLALTLDPEPLYTIAFNLYREMLAAGYTAVGEFHYLHHRQDGSAHPTPDHLSRVLIRAAQDAGIRIAVLLVLYVTGGINTSPSPRQRRFISPDLGAFLSLLEPLLRDFGDAPLVSLGLAPHSIRAVPTPMLQKLAEWNRAHHLPVHMHVCEQVTEVEQTRAHLGASPLEIIARTGLLDERFVGVHATHLEADDPQRLNDAGARVCACPTTEANLGDGFLPAHALMSAGVPICIGSDSHIVVNPMEELRLIENNERLQRRRRNVLAGLMQPTPGSMRVAPGLLQSGALHGGAALSIDAGQIKIGLHADLIALDRNDPYLSGVPTDHLAEAIVFSAGPRCVREVWVGGVTRYARSG